MKENGLTIEKGDMILAVTSVNPRTSDAMYRFTYKQTQEFIIWVLLPSKEDFKAPPFSKNAHQ